MKKLYAMLTNHCNLSCSHCVIKDAPEEYNRDKFLDFIKNFSGQIIIFGGEPTVHEDRLFDLVDVIKNNRDGKMISLTTNLIKINSRILDFYKEIKGIGTSWNYSRFTESQYDKWLSNINILEFYGIKADVLITLTEDLINTSPRDFLDIISKWNKNVIRRIKFEQCIDCDLTKDHYGKVDNWLCELYSMKDIIPLNIHIFEKGFKWHFNCDNAYTITPDAIVHKGCPNGLYFNNAVPTNCLTCSISDKCRPCRLQQYCTRPKKLMELIEREENNNG